jgi:hypothetical protein
LPNPDQALKAPFSPKKQRFSIFRFPVLGENSGAGMLKKQGYYIIYAAYFYIAKEFDKTF